MEPSTRLGRRGGGLCGGEDKEERGFGYEDLDDGRERRAEMVRPAIVKPAVAESAASCPRRLHRAQASRPVTYGNVGRDTHPVPSGCSSPSRSYISVPPLRPLDQALASCIGDIGLRSIVFLSRSGDVLLGIPT